MDGATASLSGFDPRALAADTAPIESAVAAGLISGAVTLIWRRGEVVQVNTIGKRDIDAGLPMTRDTLFRIASMTKPITSVAIMMLMEEGKLDLHDPITRWAPEFADMRVLRSAAGPVDQTAPASPTGSPPPAPSPTPTRRRSAMCSTAA
ncbi:MAG: serine hydrolase domain-containing protein [Caulobacteraceae bacterium]